MLPKRTDIHTLLSWGRKKLPQSPLSLLESEVLLASVLSKPRTYLYAHPELQIGVKLAEIFKKHLNRRVKSEPIAYITNVKEFYGRNFYVDHNVLIPRPETEGIIKIVTDWLIANQTANIENLKIADLGTGSGCLAITLALEIKLVKATVFGLDISPDALKIARKNWKNLRSNSQNEVRFLKKDLLSSNINKKFEIIVSNPPYLTTGEIPQLAKDVSDFEPLQALIGGADGLIFYRRLAMILKQNLTPKGIAVIEINSALVEETKAVFADEYGLNLLPDLSGRPRYLVLTFRQ
jgi:release factor glutamine methyltransferase